MRKDILYSLDEFNWVKLILKWSTEDKQTGLNYQIGFYGCNDFIGKMRHITSVKKVF